MNSQKYLKNSLYTIILLGAAIPVFAGNLYRYNDEDGVPTIGRTLPAEFSSQGYDIIDDKSMRLIKRVPPAMSDTEIAEKKQQLRAQQEADAAMLSQQQADQRLIESYNSELDLIRARDARVNNIQRNIDLASGREEKLTQTLHRLEQKAADQELSGQPISDSLAHKIASTQEDIQIQQNEITQQQAEMKQVTALFDADHQRLKQLLQTTE